VKARKRNHGANIGKLKRALIIAAYDGRCWICGNKPETLSLDHIEPRCRGGSLDVVNLRPACPRCNGTRDRRLNKMSGKGRREAIAKEFTDTWHRRYPLPVFSEHGHLTWIDPGLFASLPPSIRERCGRAVPHPRATAVRLLEAVAA
jgi:hypothetical protein